MKCHVHFPHNCAITSLAVSLCRLLSPSQTWGHRNGTMGAAAWGGLPDTFSEPLLVAWGGASVSHRLWLQALWLSWGNPECTEESLGPSPPPGPWRSRARHQLGFGLGLEASATVNVIVMQKGEFVEAPCNSPLAFPSILQMYGVDTCPCPADASRQGGASRPRGGGGSCSA